MTKSTVIKTVTPIVILLIAYGLGQLLIAMKSPPPMRPPIEYSPAVQVLSMQPKDMVLTVDSRGTVQPKQQIELTSEVAGVVIEIADALVEGGRVQRGQLLLAVDPIDYEVALAEAKARVAEAKLLWEDEQAEYQRAIGLRGKDKTSALRQSKLNQVEAQYNSAKAQLRKAEQELAKTQIRAPFNAVIENKAVDLGQFVSSGMRLMTLLGTDIAEVRLPVTPSQVSYLRPALPAADTPPPAVDLYAKFGNIEQHWPARLARLEQRVARDTRVFYVVAEVEQPYQLQTGPMPLTLGLFVEATIEGDLIKNGYRLPFSAIHNGNEVFVVIDGHLQRRQVTVLRKEQQSVVINAGLNAGDQVVISRLDLMVEGMSVTATPVSDELALAGVKGHD
jgi:RND family efflux transporter MFP subunit